MFWRALVAFVAMPGMVAYVIPVTWLWLTDRLLLAQPVGLLLLLTGTLGLLSCVRDFYVRGKGTLAPWMPPQRLVIVGLYRYSRNPMYVCVLLVLLGWALASAKSSLFGYAALVAMAFHLRVVYGEEPWLAKTHGVTWKEYASRVPRWLGRSER
jgi:protein-S-isoprenylcysteine O-methyltransferase Ste14